MLFRSAYAPMVPAAEAVSMCVRSPREFVRADEGVVPRAAGPLELTIAAEDEGGKLGPTSLFTADAEELASEWFDIMFAGFPTQCGTEQMCDKFEKLYSWDTNMDVATQNEVSSLVS